MSVLEKNKIADLSSYNEGMKKSLLDKVFFLGHIDAEIFVDFGCANGELIKFLNMLFPNYIYIGYDISLEMLSCAHDNLADENGQIPKNIFLSCDWDEIISQIIPRFDKSAKKCVILSSIIHEVYSYSNLLENDLFWNRIFGSEFDYIAVRDMIPKRTIDRKSDINDIKNIRKYANKAHLLDFETVWGSIEQNKNLVHFLCKYRYVNNWEREVKENYFPLYAESFLEHITDDYVIEYYDEFTLPYLYRNVEKDFKISIKDTTHLKCILRKRA